MPPSVRGPFSDLPSYASPSLGALPGAEPYNAAVSALSSLGVSCLTGMAPKLPTKCGNANPLGVRADIGKSRLAPANPGRTTNSAPNRGNMSGARSARSPVPVTAATSLYLDGATVTASWLRATPLPPLPAYRDSDAPHATEMCGPSCVTRLGASGCTGLDPADIEGSLRLRLASIEEAFENATARRFITSVERAIASAAVSAVAIHRPLWSRPTCLACVAINAPARPPPIPVAASSLDEHGCDCRTENQEPSMSSPASSTMSSPDCMPVLAATTTLSTDDNGIMPPSMALDTVGVTKRPYVQGVCVYMCVRASDGGIAWTVRRRSHPPGANVPRGPQPVETMSSTSAGAPLSRTRRTCGRCASGVHSRGAKPSMNGADSVRVHVDEVIGAVAANLIEGIAGVALSMGSDRQCRRMWSGVPGNSPAADTPAAIAATVPKTTWLATETKVIVCDSSRRRPQTGCDALYTCARVAYATARLADVTARQRAVHDYAANVAEDDPRRVRGAVPMAYAPSIDSPAAALAWMRGAASIIGPTIDMDRSLNKLVVDYRTHVLACDLERVPLDPLDPSCLPDEVRALARRLMTLVRSPAEPPNRCG